MNNIKKTIQWSDYSWNPVVGCQRGCWYCYGARIRKRFNPDVPWSQLMWFDERLDQPLKVKKPSRIFVGSMSDIEYWRGVDMQRVLAVVKKCPQHTFLFLTKNGRIYGKYDFPVNSFLGVTSVDGKYRYQIQKDRFVFLSMEPLLSDPCAGFLNSLIGWVIIGALTGPGSNEQYPREEWIRRIVTEADRLQIPVFMKDNLKPYWEGEWRQEFPNVKI